MSRFLWFTVYNCISYCFLYNTFISVFRELFPPVTVTVTVTVTLWQWQEDVMNDRTCLQQVGCSSCAGGDDVSASTAQRCSSRVDAVRRRPVHLRLRSRPFSSSSSYCSASSHRRLVKTRRRKIFTESASHSWQRYTMSVTRDIQTQSLQAYCKSLQN